MQKYQRQVGFKLVLDLKGKEDYIANTYTRIFMCDGEVFSSVDQYVAYKEALYFNDKDTARKIKSKVITNFKEVLSKYPITNSSLKQRDDFIIRGTIQKYRCNPDLKEKLLAINLKRGYRCIGGFVDYRILNSVQSILCMGE